MFLFLLYFAAGEVGAEETLGWEDCLKEAKENHPDLISAEEALNQAQASKAITKSSILPRVSSSLSGSTSGTDSDEQTDSYSYRISGRQLLFDGFKTSYGIGAASENVKSARYDYEVTSANVRLRLRNAFIGLLRVRELLNITEDIAKRRKQSLGLIKLRYQAGREHRGSLLTAQANLAQALFEVAQAGRNIDLAQRQLSRELGRRKKSALRVKGDFEIRYPQRGKPDFEALSESHPSLEKLIARREIARLGLKSAQADFFPQINASTSAGKSGSEWPPEEASWSVGVSLSFSLFEGWARTAEVERKKAAFNQAREGERSGRDGIILTLEEAWINFQNAIDRAEVQKKFLAASEERAKIAEVQYSKGLISFDNWIIIEDDLVRVKKSFLDARANTLTAEANWIQAKGGTLDYEE
jgi:outer membrane protein TolC